MAKVFIDTTAHRPSRGVGPDFATNWYRSCASEPAGGTTRLNIQNVYPLAAACLDSLLDGILDNCVAGDDIIVVGHGREAGLSMRLLPASEARAQAIVVSLLGTMTERVISGFPAPAVSVAEAATGCQITASQVTALRAKISRVRALRLRHVALRGCKIGSWPDVLRMYKPFFGCREISGPVNRDTYGVIPSTITTDLTGWSSHWMRTHRSHSHVYEYAAMQVVVATEGGESDEHRFRVALAAANDAALATWQAQYLGARSTLEFPNHGQWLTLIATGQPRIIFTGDSQYVSQLTVV